MTDDITHGLALLADEAEPATVDSHAVIAQARARTRNRRTMTAAFLTVVAIGTLAVTSSINRPTNAPAARPETQGQRLTAQLNAALPEVIPARWEIAEPRPDDETTNYPPPRPSPGNGPDEMATLVQGWYPGDIDNCGTMLWYQDSQGRIEILLGVNNSKAWFYDPCLAPDCEEHPLPDGTRWRGRSDVGVSIANNSQHIEALRPDGTNIMVTLNWENNRSTPPLTVDELVKWASKLSY
jgi:hypothetical protein